MLEEFLKHTGAAYGVYEKILNEYVHDKLQKGHHFIRMLHDKGLLHCFFSNAIDLLDRKAGFAEKEYNYIDGLSLGPMCAKCYKDYPLVEWSTGIKAGTGVAYCSCGGPIKPR